MTGNEALRGIIEVIGPAFYAAGDEQVGDKQDKIRKILQDLWNAGYKEGYFDCQVNYE